MKMLYRTILAAALLAAAAAFRAEAQYFALGNDPGGTRWDQILTPNYSVIYPRGMDSLAMEYAYELEFYRGKSLAGMGVPVGKRRMPAVLHPFSSVSNGMVMWAPRRMELLTTPAPYEGASVQWTTQLAMHETRHIGHINNFARGVFRPFSYVLGEQAAGAFFGIFQNTYMYEGDAVVTETAVSPGGRGRSGEFAAYMMAALDAGDYRNMDRWICGSYRHYTPDNYVYGYLLGSHIMTSTGDYGYYGKILEMIRRRPYIPWIGNIAYRKVTGRSKRQLNGEALQMYARLWESQRQMRNPVTQTRLIVREPSVYTEYVNGAAAGAGKTYYIKSSLYRTPVLVSVERDGTEKVLRNMAYGAGRLSADGEGRMLYWTEPSPHPRWTLQDGSDVYCYDTQSGKSRRVTRGGRYFVVAAGDAGRLAAGEYLEDGGFRLVILDAADGRVISSVPMPEGVQPTDLAWKDGSIYAIGTGRDGSGIYAAECRRGVVRGDWKVFRAPVRENLTEISSAGGMITFVSDRDGVCNLYGKSLHTGKEYQLCSTPYSGKSFIIHKDSITYSRLGTLGYLPSSGKLPGLMPVPQGSFYPVADSIAAMAGKVLPQETAPDSSSFVRKRFPKAAGLFNLHSWAPFYYDVDNIMAMSFDNVTNVASAGVTLYSQNVLGTAVTKAAYCYRGGRHGAEAKFTYSGLFPVFELSFSANRRGRIATVLDRGGLYPQLESQEQSGALLGSSAKVYVPLRFNGGGWLSGLIPSFSASLTNDSYTFRYRQDGSVKTDSYGYFGSFVASARYYRMTATAASAIYPRWGFGVEAGYVGAFNARKHIGDKVFAYAYGYLPSFLNHGIRLSALHSMSVSDRILSLSGVSLSPRGFAGNVSVPSDGTLLTFDYAAPVHLGDISIPGVLFLSRAVLTPFFDIAFSGGGNLLSAGADVKIGFKVFNMPYPVEAGVRLSGNAGSLFPRIEGAGRFYAGFLFGISFT